MAARPGLRVRTAVGFAVVALLATTAMGVLTYQFARRYLVEQRDDLATRQAIVNASIAKSVLAATDPDIRLLVTSLSGSGTSRPLVRASGTWYSGAVQLDPSQVPDDLVALVDQGVPASRRVLLGGSPVIVVGIPLPAVDAAYFEATPMRELPRTLRVIGLSLVAAAMLATASAAGVGWWASGQVIRPLSRVAATATAIRQGRRNVRLDAAEDPDLEPLADSFNDMVDDLEARIAREQRFTADVSHELRTPITAISSAVQLAKRAELPPRAATAIGLLEGQVDHLRRLVLDLLEISRFDASNVQLELDPVDLPQLARGVLDAMGEDTTKVRARISRDVRFLVDRRRVERILANLVENAKRYADGITAVTITTDGRWVDILVDDAGPGVPEDERKAIFGRFHRGAAATVPDAPKGTGLGLSLVEEHVRLHGGQVSVTSSPDGGARFVVRLPVDGPT
jgi:two-component system, OmpR family, sensor histidine kinase MtrB